MISVSCETPSDSFERSNTNDPSSTEFAGGTVTGLKAEAGSSGNIRLQWPAPEDIVTKHVIEKSLGDSLNFVSIAELDSGKLQYIDSTRDVRKNTYYRLSSYIELEGEDVFYGSTNAELTFGEISNEEFKFLDESNSLQLSWNVDAPFFTHFIISSENEISEQQESTVRIPAGDIEHAFEDPLVDVNFETRHYTIAGIIEHDGIDEVIVEKDITFDTASFFRPFNLEINILNEQDWEISWEGNAFFANEIKLVRQTVDENVVTNLPAETTSYTDSLILDDVQDSMINQFRRYQLRFVTENGESEPIEKSEHIEITQPDIFITYTPQNNPNFLTIYGSGLGYDRDLIKEYIIEKPHEFIPDRFVEIARVAGGESNFQFTDTDVSESMNPVYRVRTVTSHPSEPVSFTYSHEYKVEYSLDTSMRDITSMEVTSDQNYLVATSSSLNRFGSENFPIYIWDLNSRQLVQSIDAGTEQITDFKISPDEKQIYYTVPSEGAIYKADFPSGNNKLKIIDDAKVNFEGVHHIDASSDGTFLVGTGGRGFVKRWSLDTYDSVFLFSEYNSPTSYLHKNVAISPDGTLIGGNNGSSLILDAENGSIIESLPGAANMIDLQFSSDGLFYANVSGFNSVSIFSTETWELIDNTAARRATFNPNNSTLALNGENHVFIYDPIEKRVLDVVSDGSERTAYSNISDQITFLDENRLAVVDSGKWINVWKKTTGRRWKKIE